MSYVVVGCFRIYRNSFWKFRIKQTSLGEKENEPKNDIQCDCCSTLSCLDKRLWCVAQQKIWWLFSAWSWMALTGVVIRKLRHEKFQGSIFQRTWLSEKILTIDFDLSDLQNLFFVFSFGHTSLLGSLIAQTSAHVLFTSDNFFPKNELSDVNNTHCSRTLKTRSS